MDLNKHQPPFWSQPNSPSMPRRRSSAPLLPLPILIVVLPIIALLFLFFLLPLFLTLTWQIIRPYGTVKKGWDSLNILLVLFAILCGIFARRNDDGSNTDNNVNCVPNASDDLDLGKDVTQPHSQPWFGDHFSNTKVFDRPPVNCTTQLRRSSSSYPDLRQDGLWETGEDRFRFFDDFDVQYRYPSRVDVADNNYAEQVLRRTSRDFEEYSQVKVVPVDTFVLRSSHVPTQQSPMPPPPPPPLPPPPRVHTRPSRTYQTIGQKDESDAYTDKVKSQPPAAPPPPPPPRASPPPPPVQMGCRSEHKYVKIERRKNNATKEIKLVFASLYNQRKRIKKKHRTKNIEECGKSVHSPTEPPQYTNIRPPSPPPPPPPLPPRPSSVFQNLFKKSNKSKKVHSVPPPAPPPPPLPRYSKRRSQTPPPPPPPAPPPPPPQLSRRRNVATSGRPPLPSRTNNSYGDNLNTGNQSPLLPVPPPPPPPPYKMPEFRYVRHGDFVSLHSGRNSPRCSSPELEEVDNDVSSTDEKVKVMDGEDGVGSMLCPSPDVNIKADTFIARLRDGWRLEKMNSLREKRKMGLDPSSAHIQGK